MRRIAAHDSPTDTPAGCQVIFREATESDNGNIGCDGRNRDLLVVIENQLVVDFVGEDDEIVAAGEFGDGFEHATRADGAGRVVRIDQDNATSARADFLMDVDEVRLPAVIFVQGVSVEFDPELAEYGRIKRVVGAGSEEIVAGIEQGCQTDVHGFADAVGDENIVDRGDALARGFSANRFEGGRNSLRGGIAVL